MANGIDLSDSTGGTFKFQRFVDASIDAGEFLRVEVWNGSAWITPSELNWAGGVHDDNRWHHENYDLSEFLGASDFRIGLWTRQSSRWEHVQVDDVRVVAQP